MTDSDRLEAGVEARKGREGWDEFVARFAVIQDNIERVIQGKSREVRLALAAWLLPILWAYIGFFSYLIVWTGNIQDDVGYYFHRTEGMWKLFAILLMVFQFAVPFALLLGSDPGGWAGGWMAKGLAARVRPGVAPATDDAMDDDDSPW